MFLGEIDTYRGIDTYCVATGVHTSHRWDSVDVGCQWLTTGKNEKLHSLHAPVMKFIGKFGRVVLKSSNYTL